MNGLKNSLLFLSGSNQDVLEECGNSEKQKYILAGLSLFIPAIMAFMGATYTISTMTDNIYIVLLASFVWSLIILLLDVGLLVTYEPDRIFLIVFRFFLAICLGLVVSHPVILKIFDDEIQVRINERKTKEIKAVRESYKVQRETLESQLKEAGKNLKNVEDKLQQDILNFQNISSSISSQENPEAKPHPQLEKYKQPKSELERKISNLKNEKKSKIDELEKKRNERADEIAGKGKTRLPGCKRACKDLDAIIERLRGEIQSLDPEISKLEDELRIIRQQELKILDQIEKDSRIREQETQKQAKEERKKIFESAMKDGEIKRDLESNNIERIKIDFKRLVNQEDKSIKNIEENKLQGLLVKTLVLHEIFISEGGLFAVIVFAIFTIVFMLVDISAILIKSFAYYSGSLYDTVLKNYKEAQISKSNDEKAKKLDKIGDEKYQRNKNSDVFKKKIDIDKDSDVKLHGAKDKNRVGQELHEMDIRLSEVKLAADMAHDSFQTTNLLKTALKSAEEFEEVMNSRIEQIKPNKKIEKMVLDKEEKICQILIEKYYLDHENFINRFFDKKK